MGLVLTKTAKEIVDTAAAEEYLNLYLLSWTGMGKRSNNRAKRGGVASVTGTGANKKKIFNKAAVKGVGGKPKAKKAKAVKKTLKNIKLQNRSKIDSVDKDLVQIQDNVRGLSSSTSAAAATDVSNNINIKKSRRQGNNKRKAGNAVAAAKKNADFKELQKDKEDSLNKLDNMDIID